MKKIKKILTQKRIRIIFLIILDLFALILCSFLALAFRFDFDIPNIFANTVYKYIVIDSLIFIFILSRFKLYTSMWSYASTYELINLVVGCSLFEGIDYLYKFIFDITLPRSYYLIKFVLLIFLVAAIRYSYRIARTLREYHKDKRGCINTMMVGAGEAGRLLITEILNNPHNFGNRILCVIDDDKNKIGNYIRGIPVVGNRHLIEDMCIKYDIEEIIIAMPSVTKEKLNLIVEECQKSSCSIRILPNVNEMIGKPSMKKVRPLSYEDFLGRSEIVVDIDEISSNILNQVVLVTGGGGSIGSELCRQIVKCKPKQLVIVDIYENNAYDIEQELRRNYKKLNLEVVIASVRDYDRMENIFKQYRPTIVYHAAAHKHVPLMEHSPNEAIKNNCLGTLNTVKLADIYKVKKFVLISTDKAVRPTNVMGATKRICEMIIQAYDRKSKTDYVAVRFGNVLGSNGSVMPLFLKQIEEGGPVTVTHKEITRYFMTIPEAVSLILQALVYAEGGEIFVLDMGEPVKIYELAKKLIKFKGLVPGEDIEIKITGLRPGEKLYEELLMDEEGLKETPNKLIHIGQPIKMADNKFFKDLDKLIEYSFKNKNDIKERLAKIVTTYRIDKGGKSE